MYSACRLAVAACCVLLPAAVAALASVAGDTPDRAGPDRSTTTTDRNPVVFGPGRLVAIGGGRSLYLRCEGVGSPTVVFASGLGGSSDDFNEIQGPIGAATRACAYDRAGLGNSLPIPGVHNAAQDVADLARLLSRAGIAPPYVLVGAAYGGLLARLYAHAHPHATAGLVLVDAMVRDQDRSLLALWRAQPPALRAAIPEPGTEPVRDGVDVLAGEAQDARVRTLGRIPLIVIARGRYLDAGPPLPPAAQAEVERWWAVKQTQLAAMSSDSLEVTALHSGHLVMRSLNGQPSVVIAAVLAVIRSARAGAPLPGCAAAVARGGVACRRF